MTDIFRSSPLTVLPEWIDYNGHLNMAYYSVLMDQGADQAYPHLGFGPDYRERTGCTTYVAEFHICYLRELHEGDRVISTLHLLDYDEKRFHIYQELWHEDGWLAATGEALTLHVDQSGETPKVAKMPDDIMAKLANIAKQQADLPKPERMGRKIGITRK
ncbi:thioesterase family protein [Sulfitobacter sp. F26169L]|uniref:thioesterase family protein n=1 Tax=Sulfitobacter sp. F26169L TaxID=2996015 RepID=UPI002260A1F1|nr:thioesterase family protein [Sulfitobacter sp. F26169L]MCX7566307.1 thioesterase family protein [Sulfitobacter sp. F26169L]